MEKVDRTIEEVCNWIQSELKKENSNKEKFLPDMINALAALVAARAKEPIRPF